MFRRVQMCVQYKNIEERANKNECDVEQNTCFPIKQRNREGKNIKTNIFAYIFSTLLLLYILLILLLLLLS